MIPVCFKVAISAQVMQRSAFAKHTDVYVETVAHTQTHATGKATLLQGSHAHVWVSNSKAQQQQQQPQQQQM